MEADVQEEAVENPTLYLEITVWKVVRIILVVGEAVVEIVMEIMDRIVEVRMYLGYECLIRVTFFKSEQLLFKLPRKSSTHTSFIII